MTKTNWLAFNISMPNELIPLYNFLQNELDFILSNKKYRNMLLKLDLKKHKGGVICEIYLNRELANGD